MEMKSIDIRNILSVPAVYWLFSSILAPVKANSVIAKEYIKAKNGDRILDIGCGISRILDFLPSVEYSGVDIHRRYIEAAEKRYGDRGTFICEKVNNELIKRFSDYDIVLALGILHHLDDPEAGQLFEIAKGALRRGGRLITIDGCYKKGQSRFVRYLLSNDRGKYVRTVDEYRNIASRSFNKIEDNVRSDLIIIPYNHIIMECTA